jgi:excisionase family DNA binding protein
MMSKGMDAGLNGPRFLDVKELAEMLRLKTRTIYDMVSEGRIPYRKAGDRTIFLLDENIGMDKAASRKGMNVSRNSIKMILPQPSCARIAPFLQTGCDPRERNSHVSVQKG